MVHRVRGFQKLGALVGAVLTEDDSTGRGGGIYGDLLFLEIPTWKWMLKANMGVYNRSLTSNCCLLEAPACERFTHFSIFI